jgi:hypothetical protein
MKEVGETMKGVAGMRSRRRYINKNVRFRQNGELIETTTVMVEKQGGLLPLVLDVTWRGSTITAKLDTGTIPFEYVVEIG